MTQKDDRRVTFRASPDVFPLLERLANSNVKLGGFLNDCIRADMGDAAAGRRVSALMEFANVIPFPSPNSPLDTPKNGGAINCSLLDGPKHSAVNYSTKVTTGKIVTEKGCSGNPDVLLVADAQPANVVAIGIDRGVFAKRDNGISFRAASASAGLRPAA